LQKRRRSLPWIPPRSIRIRKAFQAQQTTWPNFFFFYLTQQILALSTVFKNIEKATKQDIFVSALLEF
jgi:hypothetical protein